MKSVYVIAEIGINHEGDVGRCKEMIYEASESGADAVKLQTINAGANYTFGTESYKVFKSSELTPNETELMFRYARSQNLDVFTTSGDIDTVNWVEELNPSAWKISSGLLTHIPLIKKIASLKRPLYISTGMANLEEIEQAILTAKNMGNEDITIFQCTSIYPTSPDLVNLSMIRKFKERYNCSVGLSDHTSGSDVAFLSVAAGAEVIEKHFTFDTSRKGFDHHLSLDYAGFKNMVDRVRFAEKVMGDGEKIITSEIQKVRNNSLRKLVALESIKKGDPFSKNNVGIKRNPSNSEGLKPALLDDLIGKKSLKDIQKNQIIEYDSMSA
jgi:N,N'-diacetyllegionaminate synthase